MNSSVLYGGRTMKWLLLNEHEPLRFLLNTVITCYLMPGNIALFGMCQEFVEIAIELETAFSFSSDDCNFFFKCPQ